MKTQLAYSTWAEGVQNVCRNFCLKKNNYFAKLSSFHVYRLYKMIMVSQFQEIFFNSDRKRFIGIIHNTVELQQKVEWSVIFVYSLVAERRY